MGATTRSGILLWSRLGFRWIFQGVDNESENLRFGFPKPKPTKLQDGGQDHVCGGVETWKDNVISQTVEAW